MKIKNIIGVAGVILIIATCLAIISPTASKMITAEQDADEIIEYVNKNNEANPEEKEYLINQMQKYNEEIANGKRYRNETELELNYYSITGRSDAIGFVKIPKINVELPIILCSQSPFLPGGIYNQRLKIFLKNSTVWAITTLRWRVMVWFSPLTTWRLALSP